tara:strand:- start:48 stop:749 length:702 start_codon:yes stop_codon:yes gene_type:complete
VVDVYRSQKSKKGPEPLRAAFGICTSTLKEKSRGSFTKKKDGTSVDVDKVRTDYEKILSSNRVESEESLTFTSDALVEAYGWDYVALFDSQDLLEEVVDELSVMDGLSPRLVYEAKKKSKASLIAGLRKKLSGMSERGKAKFCELNDNESKRIERTKEKLGGAAASKLKKSIQKKACKRKLKKLALKALGAAALGAAAGGAAHLAKQLIGSQATGQDLKDRGRELLDALKGDS